MARHLLFLRWWVIACLTGIAGYFAYQFGAITEVLNEDWTFISPTIAVLFVFMSMWCGLKTFLLSFRIGRGLRTGGAESYVDPEKLMEVEAQEDIGWFAAESFQVLGFIGTICGMIFALKGFVGVDLGDINAVQGLVSNLVSGVSVAFYTTLTGLVASLLLKMQYFNLSYARRRIDNR
jgi:hypothetical protein